MTLKYCTFRISHIRLNLWPCDELGKIKDLNLRGHRQSHFYDSESLVLWKPKPNFKIFYRNMIVDTRDNIHYFENSYEN